MTYYFLTASALLVFGTLAAIARALLAPVRPVESRSEKDARLYRQQLAELERDRERGVIGGAEAEGARAEIARRLIAATGRAEAAAPPGVAPRRATGLVAGIALIGLPILAGLIYLANGSPGLPDRPFAARGLEPTIATAADGAPARLSQAAAETLIRERGETAPAPPADPEFAALVERVEQVLAERGPEPEGLALLANGYMRLGRPDDAWRAYDRLIAASGEAATGALFALQAEAMVMAANGYVSPEAEEALARALAADPGEPLARYYSGVALAQQGRLDEAVATWEALKAEAPEGAPWLEPLDQMIAEAKAAGEAEPGPTAAEIEAAGEMSPEERQAMIQRMVISLEARLTSEGGEAEEWNQLMTSYARLGQMEDARRAYRLGREALGPEGGASFLRQQALVLGIADE